MTVETKKGDIDPVLKEQGAAIKVILKELGFTYVGFYDKYFSDKPSPSTHLSFGKVIQGRNLSYTLDVQKECVKILAKVKAQKGSIFDATDEKVVSTTKELFNTVFQGRYTEIERGSVDANQDLPTSATADGLNSNDTFQKTGALKNGAENLFELDRYNTTKVWLNRSENGSIDMNAEAHDPEETYAFSKLFVTLKSDSYLALEEVEDETTEEQSCKVERRSGKETRKLFMSVMVSALDNELPSHSLFDDLGYQVMRHKDKSAPFSIEMVALTPSRQITAPGKGPDEKDEAIDRIKWILDNHPQRAGLGEDWDFEDETKVPVYMGRFHWSPDES